MKYIFFSFAVLVIICCGLPTFVNPFELYSGAAFGGNSRVLQNPIEYIDDLICCWEPSYDDAVGCSVTQDSENSNNYPLEPYAIIYAYRFLIALSVLGCCLWATVLWIVFRGLAKMIKKKSWSMHASKKKKFIFKIKL